MDYNQQGHAPIPLGLQGITTFLLFWDEMPQPSVSLKFEIGPLVFSTA
jgi:hypothetical protein